ncbi:predicted protein [Arabidopsis lyrata subsp. lyrata]|uniref:Predicted protein n=1 Tax=Arabidopsis lyrata subsp. lyrata TaxID=81972 RepID=D7MKC6_ARALL|nr:predicted protein [Arabidopsis lyrata subsp. lyrata]
MKRGRGDHRRIHRHVYSNNFDYLLDVPKDGAKNARNYRMEKLRARRITFRNRLSGLVLPICEDDYVHFLATDSDFDNGDRENQTDDDDAMDDDLVEHLDNADECILEQEGFGSIPIVNVKPGLTENDYHRIGELLPGPSKSPAFSQLYIHDTVNEVSNRMGVMG